MRPYLAITMGDAAGVGAEITVKALHESRFYEKCIPVVLGDKAAMEDAIRFTGSELKLNLIRSLEEAKGQYGLIDMIDEGCLAPGGWKYKTVSAETGEAAFRYIRRAIDLTMAGKFQGIVTGPINKESINMAGHHFSGHTEILAHYSSTKKYAMLLIGGNLRVIHATTHVSMEDACKKITRERVYDVIKLAELSGKLLGFEKPNIAVAGFNAHCSENGLFGHQEADAIIPAIEQAKLEGLQVDGPVPPDTVFVKAVSGKYDVTVAMYHDQGHIPVKLSGFKMDAATGLYTSMSGVNCTIGLPFIRTSVDHGTAFGRAGDNRANHASMMEAIDTAITMSENLSKLQKEN